MVKVQLLITLLFYTGSVNAQKNYGNSYVYKMMTRIPESLTISTEGIAGYINENFTGNRDKSRAVFIWISRNIEYNFDSIITNSIYETPSEVSERILRSRTGVCLNFAHLFTELSNKSGIKTYTISGYTKQNGRVDYLPHIWCASYVDTAWYLFDPTWGSGYVSRGRYIRQVNNYYFMASPEKLIRSHMPFDPMWQLLYNPITHQKFKKGGYKKNTANTYFNFNDSIRNWENSTALERAIGEARRIEGSGVTNNFVAAKLRVVKGEAEYLSNKRAAEIYGTAVNRYNEGIQILNRFIAYRNNQVKDSLLLASILDTSEIKLTTALDLLHDAGGVDLNILKSVSSLKKAIEDTRMMLNLQRAAFFSELNLRKQNK